MPDLTSQLVRFFNGLLNIPVLMKGAWVNIYTQTTAVSTIADTNETDLANFSIPIGSLLQNGAGIWVFCSGFFANNANNKTVTIRFGSDTYTVVNGVVTNVGWQASFFLQRRSSGVQIRTGMGMFQATDGTTQVTTAAEVDTAAITCRITGTNGVASAGDIRLDQVICAWFPQGATHV